MRNGKVHGKEEATKQQKRKAKITNDVWALHDWQEIARSSDSFLFYPDVEEEIEHALTIKLEECIAIRLDQSIIV